MGFWPTWNPHNTATKKWISKAKMYFKIHLYTGIILMKYKEEIQVITTINEFLKFHTNPSNQHYANYHDIRSHMRRFMIQIYECRTFFTSLIFC